MKKQTPAVLGVTFPAAAKVEGLDAAPGDSVWLGMTLSERQERAFIGAHVRPGEDDPTRERVIIASDVAITAATVATMVELGRKEGRAVTFQPSGDFHTFLAESMLGREAFLAAWMPPGEPVSAAIKGAPSVEFDPKERNLELPVPKNQFGAEVLQIPMADRFLFPTSHWLQLLWANLLGLAPHLWRELVGYSALSQVLRLTWAAVRARSLHPYRVGAQLGRQGRGCRIHPTAVVEGNWLGDDVEIGAQAIVRGCVLGDGARVEDGSLVEFSVLGRGAAVLRKTWLKFSLLGARSSCAGFMQMGVLGTDAAVKHGATLMDMSFSQGVRVRAAGSLRQAPLGLAGVCVGERTIVGSGVRIAPGRILPPDVVISLPPAQVLSRIPESLEPGEYILANGGLEKR